MTVALHGRVVLPLVIALAAFVPRALPVPAPKPSRRPAHTALPTLHGALLPKDARDWDLLPADSSARILLHDGAVDRVIACQTVTGTLRLGAAGSDGSLELRLPLAALQPVAGGDAIDIAALLGVHRADELVLRVALVSSASNPLPGTTAQTWLGTLTFGDSVRRQLMQTWTCLLPGRPLRLQGHGTVPVADYGLPPRGLFSFLHGSVDVTLGLDLAFRRRRGE